MTDEIHAANLWKVLERLHMDPGGYPPGVNELIYEAVFGPVTALGYQFEWPDNRFVSDDPCNPAPMPITACPKFTMRYEDAEMLIPFYCTGGASWRVDARAGAGRYQVAVNNQTREVSGRTLPIAITIAALHYRWRVARGETP